MDAALLPAFPPNHVNAGANFSVGHLQAELITQDIPGRY
jgi:hypothetical protein